MNNNSSIKRKSDGRARRPRRMAPQEREQMILDAAIDFFAEYGFDAQIRTLAEQVGVSQALIFRYFGNKENLIDRVYQRTFMARWDPGWRGTITDRTMSLRDKLKAFLKSYLNAIDDPRWIRISIRSSLSGKDMTRRYVEVHVTDLLKLIAMEIRYFRGQTNLTDVSTAELELVWHLHSTVIYYLVRKYITKLKVDIDTGDWIDSIVDNFMDGLGTTVSYSPVSD